MLPLQVAVLLRLVHGEPWMRGRVAALAADLAKVRRE